MIKGCINLWVRAPYPNSLLCQVLGFYFYALKNTSTPAPAPEKIPDPPAYQEHHPHRPAPPPSTPPFINFSVFSEESKYFCYEIKNFKEASTVGVLKKFSKLKTEQKTHVFNSAYFTPSVNTSFQISIYQVIFLNLKHLLSHCFSTFYALHKLQLCAFIGKFWYIYVIRIKINKKLHGYSTPPPSFL